MEWKKTIVIWVVFPYSWCALTPVARFRKATKEEMKSQGGDGIVLLKAKSGYD